MENEDLKKAWNAFNKSVESVENTQKHILIQMISRKSEFRLQLMKFQSIIGILIAPTIFILVIIPMIINNEKNSHLLIGTILVTGMFIYSFVQAVKYYRLINLIKPTFEPVIKTKERVLTVKKFMVKLQNRRNLLFPIFISAIILILWNDIKHGSPVIIVFLAVFVIAIYFWGRLKHKLYFRDRINSIDLEMDELKKYQ
ncbi:MAG: hypothetical protein LBQ60_16525 [Bacteroidales bacterium]|jgi:hypothetical protein|nr:hypothetical protein [Bacteroidales bacterium]